MTQKAPTIKKTTDKFLDKEINWTSSKVKLATEKTQLIKKVNSKTEKNTKRYIHNKIVNKIHYIQL